MAIPHNEFASTARRIYTDEDVPYERGGKSLKGMDSGGFIEYCLRKHGINHSFSGTNDIYRNAGTKCLPLKEAMKNGLVKPGCLLLHVTQNGGEPTQYRKDGKGNCDYALIAISSTEGVYPSEKRGALIKTKIEPVRGKANVVMFCKYVDYGLSDGSSDSSSANDGIYTTSNLRLRKGPSTTDEVIKEMPEGTRVELLERRAEWCRVKYVDRAGTLHVGWCSSQHLTLD